MKKKSGKQVDVEKAEECPRAHMALSDTEVDSGKDAVGGPRRPLVDSAMYIQVNRMLWRIFNGEGRKEDSNHG